MPILLSLDLLDRRPVVKNVVTYGRQEFLHSVLRDGSENLNLSCYVSFRIWTGKESVSLFGYSVSTRVTIWMRHCLPDLLCTVTDELGCCIAAECFLMTFDQWLCDVRNFHCVVLQHYPTMASACGSRGNREERPALGNVCDQSRGLKLLVAGRIPFNVDTSGYKIMHDICSVHLCMCKTNQEFLPCMCAKFKRLGLL